MSKEEKKKTHDMKICTMRENDLNVFPSTSIFEW